MIYFILSSVNFVFFQMFFWKSCNNLKMRTLGYEMFGGKFSTTISWKRCVFDGTHQNPKTPTFHLHTVLSSLFIVHCSLNDNFYSLASSWNQIKWRNMTAMVLDKTLSTAWKNEFYIMDKTNWQSYWNHNLLMELVWRKNEFSTFLNF